LMKRTLLVRLCRVRLCLLLCVCRCVQQPGVIEVSYIDRAQ